MFAAALIRASFAVACVGLVLSSGAATGARRAGEFDSAFVVWAGGGHFAQDGPELDLEFEFSRAAAGPGRISVLAPAGFELYPERPVGSSVGTASVFAADDSRGSTRTVVEGEVTVARLDAAAEQAAQTCSAGTHRAIWLLSVSILGQPVDVPIYIADDAAGALRLDICAPSFASDGVLPITRLDLLLPELEAPPAKGAYLWRAFVTPVAPDRRTLLPANTYELRSRVLVPHRLTLSGKYETKRRTARLHGALRAVDAPRAGVWIYLIKLVRVVTPGGVAFRDSIIASARTKADGSYAFRVPLRTSAGFMAVAEATQSACADGGTAPRGCLNTTTAGTESDPVTISARRG